MSIWHWSKLQATVAAEFQLSLGEGDTPLLRSRRIGPSAGLDNLLFKLESVNPTGSYKDRFAAAAVSFMLRDGKKRCIATSSGNTGSALAAYCSAAGITCDIAVVETAPQEKLKQMAAYGARIFKVRGFGPDAETTRRVLEWVAGEGGRDDSALQISAYLYSPLGMTGVETISCELAKQSPGGIEHVFVPAGGGGLTLAVARGFVQITGGAFSPPRIHCVQPEGNDTIATPLRSGDAHARPVQCTTQISGLQVASVLDGDEVIRACRESGGTGHLARDDAVWDMQRRLAREEGIFCEPAAAVPVVAALNAVATGEVRRSDRIACILTGIGFKDLQSVDRMVGDGQCPTLDLSEFYKSAHP
jgi:threonine synthase